MKATGQSSRPLKEKRPVSAENGNEIGARVHSLFDWTVSSDHLFLLLAFFRYSFCFSGSVRQIGLDNRQLLGARKYTSLSYHPESVPTT